MRVLRSLYRFFAFSLIRLLRARRSAALRQQERLYEELLREFNRASGDNRTLARTLLERDSLIDQNRRQFQMMANEIVAKHHELDAKDAEIESLKLAAAFDPLTGLYNRRGAATELHRTLGAFERRSYAASGEVVLHQLSVLLMDLNHFKKVNDRHGHAVGDAVLVAVAGHLESAFRPEDIVLRKGGDEFVVYLVNASKNNAVGSAERFRQRLDEDLRLRFGDIQVSVSIGISHGSFTTRRGGLQIIGDVEALADAAMYGAKEESRDFSGIIVAADAVYSDTAFGDL